MVDSNVVLNNTRDNFELHRKYIMLLNRYMEAIIIFVEQTNFNRNENGIRLDKYPKIY